MKDKGGSERVQVFGNSVMQTWRACKDNERKECIHGSKEKLKE